MHPNPAFRQTPQPQMLAFARARGFGILVLSGDGIPLLAHVPFVLSDDGQVAAFHLARSNPIARAPSGPAVLAISGPDAYVSPDWYGLPDQVPTWNYVAVHLRGRLERAAPETLAPHLDALSAGFETRLLPKTPWTSAKMTDGVMDRMMRGIVPYRLLIEEVQGTWKLGQNKPDAARMDAASGIAAQPLGQEAAQIAALMAAVQPAGS